jgi:integrase
MQVQDNASGSRAIRRLRKPRRAARGTGSVYQTLGRWVATEPQAGKRARKFYGRTQEEAIAKREEYRLEVHQGTRDSSGQGGRVGETKIASLGDWLDHWLEYVVKPSYDPKSGKRVTGMAPTTHQNWRWHVQRHLRPSIGKIKLVDLRTSHVERWYKDLITRGVDSKPVAITSAYEARRVLVIALNYALKRRHETRITHNAASAFGVQKPYARTKPAPDPEALVRILEQAAGARLELVIHLGVSLGLRRQEIAALQWHDFDFTRGELLIRRRVNRIDGHGVQERGGVKMRDETSVDRIPLEPIDSWRALLQSHLKRALEFYAKHRATWTGLDPRAEQAFLFTNTKGEVLDPKQIYSWGKQVFARAGCPTKTLHGLRHDFAGILHDSDASLLDISRMLRHKNTAVTDQIYTHLTDERSRTVVGKAAAWLAQARIAADGTTG